MFKRCVFIKAKATVVKTLVLTEEKWRSMQREHKGRGAETLSLFQKKLIEKFTRGSLYF